MPLSFLSLPGEVRNKIYHYALVIQSPHSTHSPIIQPSLTGPWRYRGAFLHNRFRHGRYEAFFEPSFRLSILRVNRTISHEALSIFYGENIFWFICEALGAPKIDFKILNSRHSFRGIKMQRKLALAYIKSIRYLTPRLLHNKLGCGSSTVYWRGRLQHVGLIMYYDDYYPDRFEKRISSAVSLAGLLRDLVVSGVVLRTAKLDLRFGEYCAPEAFAAGSNIMKAARALDVGERIVITASGCVDGSIGGFADALARSKGWEVVARKAVYGSDGAEMGADLGDSVNRRNEIIGNDSISEEGNSEHAVLDVHIWQLFPGIP